MFADPQVQARGLAVKMPHPEAGEVPLVASPIRLSKTPVEYRRAPAVCAAPPPARWPALCAEFALLGDDASLRQWLGSRFVSRVSISRRSA